MKLGPPMFFLRNSLPDQWFLIKALVLVWCVRLGLWLIPLRVLREVIAKITSNAPTTTRCQPLDFNSVKRMASSVRRVSHYVPAASCLTQALSTQVLLGRRGQASSLRIGVTRGAEGELKAHAWLESNGEIIIGQVKDPLKYAVLNSLKEVRQ